MAKYKVDPPALKAKEEKLGKDLDGDKEKGESPAHKAKVLDKKGKGKGEIPSGGLVKMKACKKCKPGTMHNVNHAHFK